MFEIVSYICKTEVVAEESLHPVGMCRNRGRSLLCSKFCNTQQPGNLQRPSGLTSAGFTMDNRFVMICDACFRSLGRNFTQLGQAILGTCSRLTSSRSALSFSHFWRLG